MKLLTFKRAMKKGLFSWQEACRVASSTAPAVLRLQLHQWVKAGELVRIRRGLYYFRDQVPEPQEVARALYGPAYISLESGLHFYGLIPDVPFALTLVTPRTTRNFKTERGQFIYHKIKRELFWGYDPDTLMGEREKVLLDYCYLHRHRLIPQPDFWEAGRWQNLATVDFSRVRAYAQKTGAQQRKVLTLIASLSAYAQQHGTA